MQEYINFECLHPSEILAEMANLPPRGACAVEGRADARGWRTGVPSEPRTYGRGHLSVIRAIGDTCVVTFRQTERHRRYVRARLSVHQSHRRDQGGLDVADHSGGVFDLIARDVEVRAGADDLRRRSP